MSSDGKESLAELKQITIGLISTFLQKNLCIDASDVELSNPICTKDGDPHDRTLCIELEVELQSGLGDITLVEDVGSKFHTIGSIIDLCVFSRLLQDLIDWIAYDHNLIGQSVRPDTEFYQLDVPDRRAREIVRLVMEQRGVPCDQSHLLTFEPTNLGSACNYILAQSA